MATGPVLVRRLEHTTELVVYGFYPDGAPSGKVHLRLLEPAVDGRARYAATVSLGPAYRETARHAGRVLDAIERQAAAGAFPAEFMIEAGDPDDAPRAPIAAMVGVPRAYERVVAYGIPAGVPDDDDVA